MAIGAEELSSFFASVLPHMNERQRRVAGAMAKALGRGGKTAVAGRRA